MIAVGDPLLEIAVARSIAPSDGALERGACSSRRDREWPLAHTRWPPKCGTPLSENNTLDLLEQYAISSAIQMSRQMKFIAVWAGLACSKSQ